MRIEERLKVIYETIAPAITRSETAWKEYLKFSSQLYKHQFDNALLVYAQRPKATMLATTPIWNKVGRYINKGEKGTAVCEYDNAKLTLKYLFDVSQTNGKITPDVWTLDEEKAKMLTDRLSFSHNLNANDLEDCISQITQNTVAQTVDTYLQDFEADIKDHFFGTLPGEGLLEELTETIENSCKYFIAARCGIEVDAMNMQTISHFDTVPLIARLGYTVTEISKGILIEIERNVKIIENERKNEDERRINKQQDPTRTSERSATRTDTTRERAAGQVRQNGDGTPTPKQSPKIFTFEDARRADDQNENGGRGSIAENRGNNTEPVAEESDTGNRGHIGENPTLQSVQADGRGNSIERDSADTEITQSLPTQESLIDSGSFFVPEKQNAPRPSTLWERYNALTDEYPDCIVFLQLGDFFEVMGEDAKTVSEELSLVLTGRDVGLPERVPLIGVPNHKVETYSDDLVNRGYDIVIVDSDGNISEKQAPQILATDDADFVLDDYEIPDEREDVSKDSDTIQDEVLSLDETELSVNDLFLRYSQSIVSRVMYDEQYLEARKDFENRENGKAVCDVAIGRYMQTVQDSDTELFTAYNNDPDFAKRINDYVFKRTYTDFVKEMKRIDRLFNAPKKPPNDTIHRNFNSFNRMFPQIVDGTYRYMRYESKGFEPLSIQHLGGNQFSIMHTYTQEGDLMYDPDMVIEIDTEEKTIQSLSFEQSGLGLYQDVFASGMLNSGLQKQLNSFLTQWLSNIRQQGFEPARAVAVINNEDTNFVFDEQGNPVPEAVEDDNDFIAPKFEDVQPIETEQPEISSLFNYVKQTVDTALPLIEKEEAPDPYLDRTNYIEPFVVVESSESYAFNRDEYLPFGEADLKFKTLEKHERELRIERNGSLGGYNKTWGNIYYLDNENDTELSRYGFRYDIGDYEEARSGLFNHVKNYWDNVEKALETTDEYIGSNSEDVAIVKKMLEILTPYKDTSFVPYADNNPTYTEYVETQLAEIARQADEYEGRIIYGEQLSDEEDSKYQALLYEKERLELSLTDGEQQDEVLDSSGGMITVSEDTVPVRNAVASKKPILQNYRYSDDDELYPTGAKTKYKNNVAAIRLLKKLENENRNATHEEQVVLARYVGWGGLANAFNEKNQTWSDEYQELKLLLTDEEYTRARSSTLTAYYTEQQIISAIYKGLSTLGFEGGKDRKILDPAMGTGNFFSVLPTELEGTKLYGVELDSITGRIAKQLYPNANISIMGYESTAFEDNTFDVAIGNIPFNSIKVFDRRYDKENFYIHDYFMAKSIDKVKPGGIVAFITSKGTMDKYDSTAREYIATRAELLGAIRLPNDAFKALAGTEVTTDILFLKKRETELTEEDEMPEWTRVASRSSDYVQMNKYFIDNPDMILGRMEYNRSMYGGEDNTACLPNLDRDLYADLNAAVARLEGSFDAQPDIEADYGEDEVAQKEAAPDGTKNYTYLIKDEKIFFVEHNQLVPMDFSGRVAERIKGLCEIRDALLEVIAVQSREYQLHELEEAQQALTAVYDKFIGKYGFINDTANSRAFRDDDQYPLLCSIEKYNKETDSYDKEAIFTKATIKSYSRPQSVDSAFDALTLSINYYQKVDILYIANLCDKEPDEVIKELGNKIYLNPLNYYGNPYEGWEVDEEYLSGNVKRKLEYATLKAHENPDLFNRNVEALTNVQPEPLVASDISFKIGTKWIPLEYYQQFMYETFGTRDKYGIKLEYNSFSSSWFISGKMTEKSNTLVNNTFGTSRKNAYEIFEDSLNLQNVVIRDAVKEINADGKEVERYVTNPKETAIAREKQEQIRERFSSWLFQDSERAKILVDIYNDRYNVYRPRTYDGSYLNINGLNSEYKLMPHQLDFVARAAHTGSALAGHVVGAGKTLSMIATAMYMKDIGAIKKPVFVVPNNLISQWANDFYRFFPSANILVTTQRDFEKKNRQKFISKIAMGDYDAVLITQSQFEKVPVSLQRQMDMAQAQISEINYAISQAKAKDGGDWSVKSMQRLAYNLEQRIAKLAANWKKDDIIDFEQLGIDFMFVDEAHNYKNGFIYSKIRNVAGVGQSSSQRAMDMLQKCQYLQETHNGRGVVFATGTPISNSLSEFYVMQRYLQPNVLRELDAYNFDDWVSNFAEVVTALEINPEGNGYRLKSRFAKFYNLPELMNAFMLVADIKTSDMLDLETPEIEGGKAEIVVSELCAFQKRIMSILSDRAIKVRNREVKPDVDNMLAITHDARIMAADVRMLIPTAPSNESSKISQCADKIYEIWQQTAEKRLTQIVFSDIGTPKKNQFNVYDELKRQCIERGIPENEIEFIHNAKTDDEKQRFFERMKSGELRLLMGSTQKLGTGTNVQDKLYCVHHLDCPWRPSDIERASVEAI